MILQKLTIVQRKSLQFYICSARPRTTGRKECVLRICRMRSLDDQRRIRNVRTAIVAGKKEHANFWSYHYEALSRSLRTDIKGNVEM